MVGEQTGGTHNNYRTCASPKLLLNATAAAAGGCPSYLDIATYPLLWTLVRGTAPIAIATSIWAYRPTQEAKILGLQFLSDTGADNETATYDIGLFSRPPDYSTTLAFAAGKIHRGVFTLGTLTKASMTVEPFTGVSLGGTKTLRHYDTVSWTHRETGDLQVYDKGFDANNRSGILYVDMTLFDTIVICLQAIPGTSSRELVGVLEEGA